MTEDEIMIVLNNITVALSVVNIGIGIFFAAPFLIVIGIITLILAVFLLSTYRED